MVCKGQVFVQLCGSMRLFELSETNASMGVYTVTNRNSFPKAFPSCPLDLRALHTECCVIISSIMHRFPVYQILGIQNLYFCTFVDKI